MNKGIQKLSLDDVKPEDRGILGPCGIVCLACDMHKDESLEAAKTLVKIWEGFNLPDVSAVLGLETREVEDTLNTLHKFIKMKEEEGICPGCFVGAIGPCKVCPVVSCAQSKGYWTCAECDEYSPDSEHPCSATDPEAMPLESQSAWFSIVCTRYNKNNIENLNRCREIGYPAFIAEIKENVEKGFRTWQVISKEKVFQGKE